MPPQNTVCLCIGTHKTGTKALQTFLSMNRALLVGSGILVPRAGRHPLGENAFTPGHHVIAWEFLESDDSATLPDVVAEIAQSQAHVAIVNSEDFQYLHRQPARLRTIRDAFAAIGYGTNVVVYLRAQPYYAESVYGEYLKSGYVPDFDEFLEAILRDGTVARSPAVTLEFDYPKLLAPFSEVFGSGNVIVRPYLPGGEPERLFRDFLSIVARIGGELNLIGLANPLPIANESPAFGKLLDYAYRAVGGDARPTPEDLLRESPLAPTPVVQERFRLLSRDDVLRFLTRFAESNRRVGEDYGAVIPFTSEDDVPPAGNPVWESARLQRALFTRALRLWNASSPR